MKSHCPPWHLSPVQALNPETRLESVPDSKRPLQTRGGLSDSISRRKSGVSEYPRQSALQKACSNGNEKAKRSSHSAVISLGPVALTLR